MRSTAIPAPAAPLTDGVIHLRTRRADDITVVAGASADPQTRRWLGDGPMDEAAQRTSVARAEEAMRSGRSAPLLIADAVSDAPLGMGWARGLDVREVRLEIDAANTASLRVAEKCGFVRLDETTGEGKAVFSRRL